MTLNELLAAAGIVKNATAVNENSSPRIGVLFTNIINFIKDNYLYSGNPITLSLIQQNPVANFAALATTYPNPLRDWAAMVNDQGMIYCYNGTAWASTGLKKYTEDVATKGYTFNAQANLLVIPNNEFDKLKISGGYLDGGSNEPNPSYTGWQTSDKIYCANKSTHTISLMRSIMEYDENGNRTNYFDNESNITPYTFITKNNTAYFRYTLSEGDLNASICTIGTEIAKNNNVKTTMSGETFMLDESVLPPSIGELSNKKLFQELILIPDFIYTDQNIKGLGTTVNSFDSLITGITVKKRSGSACSSNISIKLYSSETDSLTGATLQKEGIITFGEYNSAIDGADLIVTFDSAYESISGSYLIITATFVGTDYFNLKESIVAQNDSIIKTWYYMISTGWIPVTANEFGLYFDFVSNQSQLAMRVLPSSLHDIPTRVKSLESQIGSDTEIKNIRSLAKSIIPSFRNLILSPEKDIYVTSYGDSIMAWQSTMQMADEGVTNVPPVCDRKGFANKLFNAIKFGDAKYRRFDTGKFDLVGYWDSSLVDNSTAIFTEIGPWYSRYVQGTGVVANPHSVPEYTTEQGGTFSIGFDEANYQRNIPKRFSNAAYASISFKIPAGNSKFDFIYHAHNLCDILTVTTNRNNGIIVMNNKQNDWANAVEAKGLTFDTAKPIQAGGYNDSLGITNMRKHFKISDTSVDTIITLTKSSDTSKYFMYWGITYWGTPTQPYALHINDMARGGYTLGSLAPVRDSDIRMTNPDLLLMEITCINSYGDGSDITNRKATLKSEIDTFKTYIDTLGIPAGFFIPHLTTASILNSYNEASEFYDYAKGYSLSKGMEIVGDSHQLIRKFWENYHSDIPYLTYVASLMYDGSTHTKEGGFMFYQVLCEQLK